MFLQLVIDMQAGSILFEDLFEKFWRYLLHTLKGLEHSCLTGMTLLPLLRVLFSNKSILKYLLALSEA